MYVLCNFMSMHCATWCPCIVQLDVHALCNLMSMHCATLCPCIVQGYDCIVQLYDHALCNLMSMHCATWCPCIVQPDSQSYVHVFMYCATLCPCIMQLDVHALCNLMSMHCATLSIYGKLGKTKSTKSCCPYIMQPDSQSYVHVFMYCATLCQLDVHVLCNVMSMHCATLCHNTWRSCCTIHGHNLHNTCT